MIDYTKLRFQRLESETLLDTFECVDGDLNDFLREEAKDYLLTVDALASATAFYEQKGGFRFFTELDEGDDTRLMYFDLKDFG
mgnify:CR=1 FL=1